jgi:hypothetical protein
MRRPVVWQLVQGQRTAESLGFRIHVFFSLSKNIAFYGPDVRRFLQNVIFAG